MGVSYNTYVGPYVRCTVERVEQRQTRRSCPNPGCPNHGAYMPAGFCPTCGSQIVNVGFIEQADAIDDWDVRERLHDRLCTASGDAYAVWSRENAAHLWKPNVSMPGRDPHLESREDFNLQDITADQVPTELVQFVAFFASEIVVLQEVYGRNAVTVHWGVLQDYN